MGELRGLREVLVEEVESAVWQLALRGGIQPPEEFQCREDQEEVYEAPEGYASLA